MTHADWSRLADALQALDQRVARLEEGHGHRISTLEVTVAEVRQELRQVAEGLGRIEIGEEKRAAQVLGELATLRLEAAETRARNWRHVLEYVLAGGSGGGAIGTGVYALLQALGA